MSSPQLPLRYDLDVTADGRIEVQLPLPTASHVTLYVVEGSDEEFNEVLIAASSSTDFLDNPEDDADWNAARTRQHFKDVPRVDDAITS